jgi:hypothetical protein
VRGLGFGLLLTGRFGEESGEVVSSEAGGNGLTRRGLVIPFCALTLPVKIKAALQSMIMRRKYLLVMAAILLKFRGDV